MARRSKPEQLDFGRTRRDAVPSVRATAEQKKAIRTPNPPVGQFDADKAFGMHVDTLYATIEDRYGFDKSTLFIPKRVSAWPELDALRIALLLLDGRTLRAIADELYTHQGQPDRYIQVRDVNEVYALDLQEPVRQAVEINRVEANKNMYLHAERSSSIARWRDVICKRLRLADSLDLFTERKIPPRADLATKKNEFTLEDVLFVCYRLLEGATRSEIAEEKGKYDSNWTSGILDSAISEEAAAKLRVHEAQMKAPDRSE